MTLGVAWPSDPMEQMQLPASQIENLLTMGLLYYYQHEGRPPSGVRPTLPGLIYPQRDTAEKVPILERRCVWKYARRRSAFEKTSRAKRGRKRRALCVLGICRISIAVCKAGEGKFAPQAP